MNTLTKLALGLMGQPRAQAAVGDATRAIPLPAPRKPHRSELRAADAAQTRGSPSPS